MSKWRPPMSKKKRTNRFKKRSRDAVRKRKLCGEEVRRVPGL